MRRYNNSVITSTGVAVPGATVTVRLASIPPGIGALATLYGDEGVTTTPNPTSTDAFGRFGFYAAAGRYDITISGSLIATYTLAAEEIADVVGPGLSAFYFAINGWGAGASITSVVGTQVAYAITVTAGTAPSVGPTITFTYPAIQASVPRLLANMIGGTGDVSDVSVVAGTTSALYTYEGLPQAGSTYTICSFMSGI
jgi:hypothetical protein